VTGDRSRVGVVDLNSGQAVVIPTASGAQGRGTKPETWADPGSQKARPGPSRQTTITEFVSYVADAVLDPFKVGIVLAALIVWGALRTRGRSA